jgi:HEAT repeat protein
MNLALVVLALLPAQVQPPPKERGAPTPTVTVADEAQTLRSANLPVTGPALLDLFRRRCPPAPERKRIAEHIQRLLDKTPAVRAEARVELIKLGPAAVPLLRQAANNIEDRVGAEAARFCLEQIEGGQGANLIVAAVRRVAQQKPAGAAGVLLAYLPFADNALVVQEIETALIAAGMRDGTIDPDLFLALKDPLPIRRGTAAFVLCKLGGAGPPAVRSLLLDPRPSVRLRAAQGLLSADDIEAVPVLIDLLADLPAEQRKPAEEYLSDLAGEWKVAGPTGNDALSGRLRREMWAAWWRQTDGEHLVEEFRRRTLSDADRSQVLQQIARLADASAEEREKAVAALVEWGPRIAPLLREAASQGPACIGPLIARCQEAVGLGSPLPVAAARLLALRKPPEAVETLLAYLPDADDPMRTQILDLLPVLACPNGKPAPALLQALSDKVGLRRSTAAKVLCKANAPACRPAVRTLLHDDDREVRLQVALTLGQLGDKEAIPVLIALLAELPLEQAWEAEDFLLNVAGQRAPRLALTDEASRTPTRDAWARWWREYGADFPLTPPPADQQRGGLLVVENFNLIGSRGRVLEVNPAGKVRWQIDGLAFPWDAQVLPNGQILVVEQNNRLSLRDRKGAVVWEKQLLGLFSCQRLRNGHTFLACRSQLLELDDTGKVVFTYPSPNGTILAARKMREGQTALVTYQGSYVRLDRTGQPVKTLQLPLMNLGLGGGDIGPGDQVVVSVQNLNKVMEYGPDGKLRWQTEIPAPGIPQRLPNGETLVSSNHNVHLLRLDAAGKIVSEWKDLSFRPFRVHSR